MAKTKVRKPLTAENLEEELWNTLLDTKEGLISSTKANAVVKVAGGITDIERIRLQAMKLAGKKPNPKSTKPTKFLTGK